jgi:uncharacterized membrane protein YeaQ/YmgE (transglycosylase-associated protein family)
MRRAIEGYSRLVGIDEIGTLHPLTAYREIIDASSPSIAAANEAREPVGEHARPSCDRRHDPTALDERHQLMAIGKARDKCRAEQAQLSDQAHRYLRISRHDAARSSLRNRLIVTRLETIPCPRRLLNGALSPGGHMSIIGWIVLGLIAGFIASKIVNRQGEGIVLDIVLGIVGAVVGGWIMAAFGGAGVTGFNLYSMFVAVAGAVVLLLVFHAIRRAA